MGKACLILVGMMLVLAFYPKNEVHGASLENPMDKELPDMSDMDMMGPNRDRDENYDYDFLNQHRFAGGFPRGLKAMQRRDRLMKRLRRHAMDDQPPFPDENNFV